MKAYAGNNDENRYFSVCRIRERARQARAETYGGELGPGP